MPTLLLCSRELAAGSQPSSSGLLSVSKTSKSQGSTSFQGSERREEQEGDFFHALASRGLSEQESRGRASQRWDALRKRHSQPLGSVCPPQDDASSSLLGWERRGRSLAPWSRDDSFLSLPLLEGESRSLLCITGVTPSLSARRRGRGPHPAGSCPEQLRKGTTAARWILAGSSFICSCSHRQLPQASARPAAHPCLGGLGGAAAATPRPLPPHSRSLT